jgi:hypothetical protein
MRIAYLDCFSGISGDMFLGALLDAGVSLDQLRAELEKLGVSGWTLDAQEAMRAGLRATKAIVGVEQARQPTPVSQILDTIRASALSPRAKEHAAEVFRRLGEAEAKVHGAAFERVHLHEAGSLDAVVDVVGACAGLEILGVERLWCSPLPMGGGMVKTQHGLQPIPGPAVLELVKACPELSRRGLPVEAGPEQVELTTPTGAALAVTLCESFGPPPAMTLEKVGYGAGTRELSAPNVLRLWVGESAETSAWQRLIMLETNIDDMSPELYGHVSEKLFEAGALDVSLISAMMKKGRPGVLVRVLAPLSGRDKMADILFRETSTLGVRSSEVLRQALERERVEVQTPWGAVGVKIGKRGEEVLSVSPEYEECAELARRSGVPLKRIMEAAMAAALPLAGQADSTAR